MNYANRIIGIDPGKSGAIAILDCKSNEISFIDFKEGARLAVDKLREALREPPRLIAVELVHSMPGQGVASTFSFGKSAGWIEGALDAFAVPYRHIAPQGWMKGVLGPKAGKDGALLAAGRLFPKANFRGARGGRLDGRADAALIADWARRTYFAEASKAFKTPAEDQRARELLQFLVDTEGSGGLIA